MNGLVKAEKGVYIYIRVLINESNVYITSNVIFHNSRFVDHGIYVPSNISHSFL